MYYQNKDGSYGRESAFGAMFAIGIICAAAAFAFFLLASGGVFK